jgi:hypothetical protein
MAFPAFLLKLLRLINPEPGMLYAVGGRHDSGYRLKTVECFNVQTQEWEYCPEMREARGALRY